MAKSKTITDYIKKENSVCIQIKLEETFFDEVNKQRKKDGLKWRELIRAGLKWYIDESKGQNT